LGIKTALAVPIRVNNQLFGAVMVLNRLDGGELTDRDSLLVEEYLDSLVSDER
jgi:GAF domain-containing protein